MNESTLSHDTVKYSAHAEVIKPEEIIHHLRNTPKTKSKKKRKETRPPPSCQDAVQQSLLRDSVSPSEGAFGENIKAVPYRIKLRRSPRIDMIRKRKKMEKNESVIDTTNPKSGFIRKNNIKMSNGSTIPMEQNEDISIDDISVFYQEFTKSNGPSKSTNFTKGTFVSKGTFATKDTSEKEDEVLYENSHDGRQTNGIKNEIRERIIEMLVDLPEKYAHDTRWTDLRDKFLTAIRAISPYTFRVCKKGGRNFSYDFDFIFIRDFVSSDERTFGIEDENCGLATSVSPCNALNLTDMALSETESPNTEIRKIEFKYSNTSTIDSLPQVYQKSCNTADIFQNSDEVDKLFPAYYYKNGLAAYCETDDMLRNIQRPILEEYIKKSASNASTDPFFVELKNRCTFHETEKNEIVNSTIETYIRDCVKTVDIHKVSTLLRETQTDKIYLIWNYKTLEFHVDQIPEEELVITRVASVSKNTIVFQAKEYTYHFLLRWKNRKGILNPAWQVSLKTKVNNRAYGVKFHMDKPDDVCMVADAINESSIRERHHSLRPDVNNPPKTSKPVKIPKSKSVKTNTPTKANKPLKASKHEKIPKPEKLPKTEKLVNPEKLPKTEKLVNPEKLPKTEKLSKTEKLVKPDSVK